VAYSPGVHPSIELVNAAERDCRLEEWAKANVN
jgi:hypothetical protein